jgi:hypothetical protein
VAGRESRSGSDGGYEVDSVPAGTHQVVAAMAGFTARTFEAEIRPGIDNLYDIELAATSEPAPPELRIATSDLPLATVDVPYEASLEATGGTPPYRWGGEPPLGLAITSDGRVSGTPGFPAGTYRFGVGVQDATFTLVSGEITLEIQTASGLRAVGEELSRGEEGVPYADTLRAEGGAPPYTFEVAGLPEGLQLDPATGVVSGTPAGGTGLNGEPITLELIVRDIVGASAFDSVSIGILPALVVITSDLPDGQVGVLYEAFLEHEGGFGTFDEYTVISGTLPPGLGISGPESLFGSRVQGTPILAGTYRFTLQLSLCVNPLECNLQLATRDYEVLIAASPLSIVTSSLPDAEVGTSYSVFLVRQGGAGPFTWDVISGTLPAGVSLTADGELAGTPTTAGDTSFEVRVRDAGDQSATAALTLHVDP